LPRWRFHRSIVALWTHLRLADVSTLAIDVSDWPLAQFYANQLLIEALFTLKRIRKQIVAIT